jgi:hypothetical protein
MLWRPPPGEAKKRGWVHLRVKKGTKYALVVGKTVYTLDGHEAELDKLAGARATVKGSVMGEMVIVESLAAARKAVK